MAILHLVLLGTLVKILMETESPYLPACIYAGITFLVRVALGVPLAANGIWTLAVLLLAAAYFWVLNVLQEGSAVWWVVLLVGMFIAFL